MLSKMLEINYSWREAVVPFWLRNRNVAFALAAGTGFLLGCPAMSACYGPLEQLPAPTFAKFSNSPGDILKLNNAELISKVRDLVASSPQALQLLLRLLSSANPAQVSAIGMGLGQVALVCVRTDQAFATEIQNVVVGIDNSDLTLAFSSVLGDRPIGAVGGGDGGFSGGGGGPINPTGFGTGGFFRSPPTPTSFFTKNTGFNYFTSNFLSGPGAPTITTTATATVNSVSPTR
jgi:hypothetical protein